jgi:hypothetical protein
MPVIPATATISPAATAMPGEYNPSGAAKPAGLITFGIASSLPATRRAL